MLTVNKSRPPTVDSTQVMLQRNDRIREKHMREMKRLGSEAQRSNDDMAKQIEDLQKEIRDIHAYTTVYKDNSLVCIDEKRCKPSYSNFTGSTDPVKQPIPDIRKPPIVANKSKVVGSPDPFRVKNCLLDVDFRHKENKQSKSPSIGEQPISVRKRMKRSSTATTTRMGGSSEYQSLLPGKCTSYYSIRKFYEQEKDKLLHKWSPEERRKRTVQWILNNNTLPQFSVIRRTTTSAIFRDFHKYRSVSDMSNDQLSLPVIDNDTRHQPSDKNNQTISFNDDR